MKKSTSIFLFFICSLLMACQTEPSKQIDSTDIADHAVPLPSWNDTDAKQKIVDFVMKTTDALSTDFIPEKDRIAVFDNDGTLWTEKPMYFQMAYALDYIKKESKNNPDWEKKEPYKSVLSGDMKGLAAGGEKAIFELIMTTHAGMNSDEFSQSVSDWLKTAIHPKTGKPYQEMVFQPMLELLDYLRANGYKTFIVSGGGIDFMRVWAEQAYGIPPYQVIGSSIKSKYEVIDSIPVINKLPEINFIDDKEGKPVGIYQHIGKRPIFAAGNSDGDYEMLQYSTTGDGPRFGMIIHHTDSVREYAYDRNSPIGNLVKGLDDASKNNWLIVDMKTDWNKIFSFD